ncbi:DUF5702 domain-containing protein [Anaerocolumna xylanovorans]|uniref:Uncharacterized protein n=1 Tax=Anaerocolumna xylanovorans DSM 12503 TaxID=1121345 RepID=A0A1M7YME4_9FIRM|nr:DUF5702 domain-containing protein [Anaerocolumna xylanovorans]SHO53863.1 hypothetical protein SAMN02745217_04329 [Anaerocolumna xylanovorans DSM 12503]
MKKKESGVITVFLSIILLAVLALILTTEEAVRLESGHVMADRAFDTSMDSAFAGYYGPLFEEYHVFGLDTGFGSKDADYNMLTDKLKEYMDYTFNPGKDMDELPVSLPFSFQPYGIKTEKIDITRTQTLLDKDGELFAKQASEYMKYKVPENGVKSLLEKLKIMEGTGKTGEILEQKQDAQETEAELEGKVLKLMEAIDGFEMKKHGIKTEGDMAKIKGSFVKKLWTETVDRNSLGIDNDWLFQSVRGHYLNPLTELDGIRGELQSLYNCPRKREEASNRLKALQSADTSKYTKKEKKKHADEIAAVQEEIENYKKEEEGLIENLNMGGEHLESILKAETGPIEEALRILDEMEPLSEKAKAEAAKYGESLKKYKEEMGGEASENIPGDLEPAESDTDGALQYDFDGMEVCISSNKAAIEEFFKQHKLSLTSDKASWQAYENSLGTYEECVNSLDFSPLKFSYSGCMKPKDSGSFFKGLNKIIDNGLMELVIEDTDTVSKNKIDTKELPSGIMNTAGMEEDEGKPAKEFGLDSKKGIYSPVFSSLKSVFDLKGQGADILNNILYLEYIKEHFDDYMKGPKNGKKVLSYEKEYILCGEEKDSDNLKGVVNKIVLLRSLADTIILLADTKSREEAQVMAAGFVGFTGMPAIIEAVKYVIIVTWGFCEALVDTAAIFSGKSVPIIKQKKDFSLALTDIFGLTKERILEKASKIKEDGGFGCADYETYLDIFLFLKNKESKTYHSLDLIQENLRAEYGDNFCIKNCLAGFEAEGEFQMESRFIDFPFITGDKELTDGVYRYHIKKGYVY